MKTIYFFLQMVTYSRSSIKTNTGEKRLFENFHTLRVRVQLDEYVQIFIFNFDNKRILYFTFKWDLENGSTYCSRNIETENYAIFLTKTLYISDLHRNN